ncbi:hypothetical protein JCM11641_002615 [Rhodosporidiobolus odoratus]
MRFIACLFPFFAFFAAVAVGAPSSSDPATTVAARIPFEDRTIITVLPTTTQAGRIPLRNCTTSAQPSASSSPGIYIGTSYRFSYWDYAT